jgi:hypothetical protein
VIAIELAVVLSISNIYLVAKCTISLIVFKAGTALIVTQEDFCNLNIIDS